MVSQLDIADPWVIANYIERRQTRMDSTSPWALKIDRTGAGYLALLAARHPRTELAFPRPGESWCYPNSAAVGGTGGPP